MISFLQSIACKSPNYVCNIGTAGEVSSIQFCDEGFCTGPAAM